MTRTNSCGNKNKRSVLQENLFQKMPELLAQVRLRRPLVHNITNWVVTNVTANILLASGASPVMAHAKEEVEEMVSIANALVLNIGTLTPYIVDSMILAGRKANLLGIPVVFDPVGAGATSLRTNAATKILSQVKVDILRGNTSEISVVAGFGGKSRGVDSGTAAISGSELATEAAKRLGCVVAVTGKTDYVSDGANVVAVENGHELLTMVTGTGCMATSLIGAFSAVAVADGRAKETQCKGVEGNKVSEAAAKIDTGTGDSKQKFVVAASSALSFFGLAAERAACKAKGPGSFQVLLFDEIHAISPSQFRAGARVKVLKTSEEQE